MAGKNQQLVVQGVPINLAVKGEQDYISLTDMTAKFDGGLVLIDAWLRNKDTVELLGTWERIHNPDFNSVEFDRIRMEAGLNRFRLSVKKWREKVQGIGLIAKTGRYGGTFAHRDIAFDFGGWLSPEFKLYLIQEFQRLKQAEAERQNEGWDVHRLLAKAQYRVHTDAVKSLIPPEWTNQQAAMVYANEADLLNIALFGISAAQWKVDNPNKGNLRENITSEQLLVLSTLEVQNALLIKQNLPQQQRSLFLREQARSLLKSLLNNPTLNALNNSKLLK